MKIRANSVLPARRQEIELRTADGLTLVGELARPFDHEPVATLICLHPLPTHGGMMDSHLLRKAAWRLPALAGIAVLRFNTRGTASVRGTSEGAFDEGEGERFDVAAAIEYAEFAGLPSVWLVGWSFGSELALRYGAEPSVVGAIVLSPPLKRTGPEDLVAWDATGKPLVALVPELDDYLRPAEAVDRFSVIRHADVIGVAGAKHLWVGHSERVLDEIVRRVAPQAYPLPTEWEGDVTYGDSSAYRDRTTAVFTRAPARPADASE